MKITEFNRQNLKEMRAEINKALAPLSDKYGVVFGTGNIRFTRDEFTVKLTVGTVNEGAPAQGKEVKDFLALCHGYGLEPTDLGKTFVSNGTAWVLVGLKPKSYKFPFLGERYDGKRFKFTEHTVRRGLGKVEKSRPEDMKAGPGGMKRR